MELKTLNFIKNNWNGEGWESKVYHQQDNGVNLCVGEGLSCKAVEFSCSHHTKSLELYPHKTTGRAVVSDLVFTLWYFPHKMLTSMGNGLVGVGNLGYGTFKIVKNFSQNEFKKMDALAPAKYNFKRMLVDGLFGFTWCGLCRGIPFGNEIPYYALTLAITGVALYAMSNPHGFQKVVHDKLSSIHVTPLTDGQIHRFSRLEKAVAILDGRYSLERLLDIHFMGKSDQPKFEEVKIN